MTVGVPSASTAMCRLRPLPFLPAWWPPGPPLSAAFADRLSMEAPVGMGERPAHCRARSRSRFGTCSGSPPSRHARKRFRTVENGGYPGC